MRLDRLVPLGLVGGVAIWALRETRRVAHLAGTPVHGGGVDGDGTPVLGQGTGEGADGATAGSRASDTVDELVATEAAGSTIDDLAHGDSEVLVEAERELLTVPGEPGETHRRRDQTAGIAAQEIAAAQVRGRRNGESV